MIKMTLIWSFVALVVAILILLFINGGGLSSIINTSHSIPTLKDILLGAASSSSEYQLPGQGNSLSNLGIQMDTNAGGISGDTNASYVTPPPSELSSASDVQTYGAPSPDIGKVSLSAANTYSANPAEEYVALAAADGNIAPVDISGWSLQSMVSGVRITIPLAASPFVLGIVNPVGDVRLAPGAIAIVVSGISPVGVSFRETMCTGYLNQMQSFTPSLANSCPARERVVPYTAENVARFGQSCFDYMQSLPQCDFPTSVPSSLSPNCRSLLTNTFSYNGCVNMFQSTPEFSLNNWRLFGGFTRELWRNDHDIIRLIDREGRTVDSVTY